MNAPILMKSKTGSIAYPALVFVIVFVAGLPLGAVQMLFRL